MKTFVTDGYQVTLMDNGGVEVRMGRYGDIYIIYNPNAKKPWTMKEDYGLENIHKTTISQSITGLRLLTPGLVTLHEALEVVGKQDLMDNEIVFMKKEK